MDWISKEFFPVFVDLSYHFLRITVLWVVFATREPCAKFLYAVFDSPDINPTTLVIESITSRGMGNAHGFT